MNKVSLSIGALVLVVVGGYLASTLLDSPAQPVTPSDEAARERAQVPPSVSPQETGRVEETAPVVRTDGASSTEVNTAGNSVQVAGSYQMYSPEKVVASSADRIFLFFHATWCPSCRALDADIAAHAATIPTGVEIYKVDYDTATDLKRRYGVTTQHSIIEIAASGEALSSITHPSTLEGIVGAL